MPDPLPLALTDDVPADDGVGLYMRQALNHPLLSGKEELELGRKIADGQTAKHLLSKNLFRDEDHADDLRRAVRVGKLARDRMTTHNLQLVMSVALPWRTRAEQNGLTLMDLVQEGNIGLMKAVDKFDYKRGYKFSTYALWWIRQAVKRALLEKSRVVRVPTHLAEKHERLQRFRATFESTHGREPSVTETITLMRITPRQYDNIMRIAKEPLSLEWPTGRDGAEEGMLGDFVPGEVDVATTVENDELRDKLEDALQDLTPREAKILRIRNGFDTGNPLTLEELGKRYGLTRERIRQIERNALKKLQQSPQARRLRPFFD